LEDVMAGPRGAKTTLAFGLVKCPVALYKTTSDEKDAKWDTAGPNGGVLRLRDTPAPAVTETVRADPLADRSPEEKFAASVETAPGRDEPRFVEEGSGQLVATHEVRRGIRKDDGTFLDLTEGLAQIAERTRLEEMRVTDFIRIEQVQRERIVGSYFLAPDGEGAPKVVRLLSAAMRETHRAAVVKWTKRSKQSLGVLVADPRTCSLRLIEMAWAEDVREAPEKCHAPRNADVTEEEVQNAIDLVNAMASNRAESLDAQADDARAMRRELVARAEAGETFAVPARPVAREDASLVELLRASVNDDVLAAAAA
jgi:non-homologous end joining protein Ku